MDEEKAPAPMKKIKRTHSCEWCEKPAVHRFSVSADYIRYCCEEHVAKTRRLFILDGHEFADHVYSTQPFTYVVEINALHH